MIIVINSTISGSVSVGEIPIGAIVMWYGSGSGIPSGYIICDGASGSTPDLRGKFVKCASSSAELLTTGGSATHLHAGGTSDTGGAHSHDYNAWSVTGGTYLNITSGGTTVQAYSHTHNSSAGTLSSAGAHTHTSSGTSGLASSLPPAKYLYWIKRIS